MLPRLNQQNPIKTKVFRTSSPTYDPLPREERRSFQVCVKFPPTSRRMRGGRFTSRRKRVCSLVVDERSHALRESHLGGQIPRACVDHLLGTCPPMSLNLWFSVRNLGLLYCGAWDYFRMMGYLTRRAFSPSSWCCRKHSRKRSRLMSVYESVL